MNPEIVHGKTAEFKIMRVSDATYYSMFCVQNVGLTIQTEQIPASGPTSGNSKRNKPGRSSWEISVDGLAGISSDSTWDVYQLSDEQVRQEGVSLQLLLTGENGNIQRYSGNANIDSISINPSAVGGALVKMAIHFTGDGELVRNGIIIAGGSVDIMRYFYKATGAETFFSDSSLIFRTIISVSRDSDDALEIVTSGTPTARQVKYTAASGRIDFNGSPAGVDEQFVVIYK